ncbi:hypothetical protein PAXINDRAFT_15389 [Paxillus involutus ATCC 200175]|uniref:Uncharacterized protein n=1 Tax=Paxillus involutus ATCC 200175 TaxID=664439 RepID=A0A0C9TWV4_PAXIN|nr:hypothetical protein PAXINDRAFT_15389 [Paxillus involutus ATCC 200175]
MMLTSYIPSSTSPPARCQTTLNPIVSRKRTRNFLDIASVWKHSVLQNIRDADAASDSSDEYWAALDVVME